MTIEKRGKYIYIPCDAGNSYLVNARKADVIGLTLHDNNEKFEAVFFFGKKKHSFSNFSTKEDWPILRKYLKIGRQKPNILKRIFNKIKGGKDDVTQTNRDQKCAENPASGH